MAKAADLLKTLGKGKAAAATPPPADPAPVEPPDVAAPAPTEEPAPAVPAPAAEPAESDVETDAPPAAAGGETAEPEPTAEPIYDEVPGGIVIEAVIVETGETVPAVEVKRRVGPNGLPLFRVHTMHQPDLIVEGDTEADAIERYKAEYGILSSAHGFVATPVYE